MKLVRYNPFNELNFWGNSFNDFFNDSLFKAKTDESWYPAVDILNENDQLVLWRLMGFVLVDIFQYYFWILLPYN